MCTRQLAFALEIATTMDQIPIVRLLHPYLPLMLSALEREAVTHAAILAGLRPGLRALVHDFNNFAPCSRLTSHKFGIAEEVEAAFGSG